MPRLIRPLARQRVLTLFGFGRVGGAGGVFRRRGDFDVEREPFAKIPFIQVAVAVLGFHRTHVLVQGNHLEQEANTPVVIPTAHLGNSSDRHGSISSAARIVACFEW